MGQENTHLGQENTILARKPLFWLGIPLFWLKYTFLAKIPTFLAKIPLFGKTAFLAKGNAWPDTLTVRPGMSGNARDTADSGFLQHPEGVNFRISDILVRDWTFGYTPAGSGGTRGGGVRGVVVPGHGGYRAWCGPYYLPVVRVRAASLHYFPL